MNKRNFHLAHVLSRTHTLRDLPRLISTCKLTEKPWWLISAADEIIKTQEPMKDYFGIKFDRLLLDSGGYSIVNGGLDLDLESITGTKIAEAAEDQLPQIVFGPDFPAFAGEMDAQIRSILFDHCLEVTKRRTSEFYDRFDPKSKVGIINAIQGPTTDESGFTLKFRKRWYDAICAFKDSSTVGVAVGADDFKNLQHRLYFYLQPWGYSEKVCHLFGVGDIGLLPLLVYLGKHFYDHLTSDVSTYTVYVAKYQTMFFKSSEFEIRRIELGRKKYDGSTACDKCECEMCLYYNSKFGRPISKDAADSKLQNINAGYRLQERVAAHNILLIERYVESLHELLDQGDSAYHAKIKEVFGEEAANGLEFLDSMKNTGRDKYESQISLLSEDKRVKTVKC